MTYKNLSVETKQQINTALEELNLLLRTHGLYCESMVGFELYSKKHGYLGLIEDLGHSLSLLADSEDYLEMYSTERKE